MSKMLRRRMWVRFVLVVLTAAIGVLGFQYLKTTTLSLDCSIEVLQDVSSPDGKYVATLFERNCGATTPYHRVVMLRSVGTKLNAEKHGDWVFSVKGQPEIQLKWEDGHHLAILSDQTDEAGGTHGTWKEVQVIQRSRARR